MSHPSAQADTGAGLSRLAAISAALRPHDPGAQVALDPDHGSVQVLTVLDPEEVDRILAAAGIPVAPTPAGAGGGCGCGCSCSGG
ncbi:hypothetical protein EIM48_03185 [Pseudoxanthomonas sp. SGNA-20]|mgnify:CR=1 FL=1|jgi:hypothetical protein|uniref:Uncharacterized protein n=2 Tax=Pseudoxanthomonas taiwanensis TaxID=176598 RepID=A0A921P3G9_9GAMM|nr:MULTISPECIES: hypothetical protein [Pseudoxanthomonas]KAF1689872.1 hypothetical protein CR938_04435 [Pseudoxanthomonas taiwanensis]RRN59058.1 hypothetical protein EIM48_03185 [Pseudoxanthomonas sp. SGNA-20]TWH14962.1 hypothetical protein L613_002000000160 [Pseudoxanthomonas taiwanensis J19]